MADLPDFGILHSPGDLPQFIEFPHRLVLRPKGIRAAGNDVSAAFLVDPDCGLDVLNSAALAEYLKRRIPVLIQAQRARDLRPFLRRQDSFRRRGYLIEVSQ
jgi:hypothetical protein